MIGGHDCHTIPTAQRRKRHTIACKPRHAQEHCSRTQEAA